MENLELYEKVRKVPDGAKRLIQAGRLKGKTDINPMWRIKALTEQFGTCGIGWKYVITDKRLEQGANNEIAAFLDIDLYIKVNGEWSEAIPGTGGSAFVSSERNGLYTSDECVDGSCEVLTRDGWISFKDYNGTDEIAQFDKDTSAISFVKPTRFIHKVSADLYDKGGVVMTAHHRNLAERKSKGDRVVLLAEDFAKNKFLPSKNGYGRSKSFRDIKCGQFGAPKQLTAEQRIGIMIACDGTVYRQNANGDIFWRLEFSKTRKVEKAKKLLQEFGVQFRETTHNRKNGTVTTAITFSLNGDYKNYKSFLPYGNYPELWGEIISWDGCKKSGIETFCTTNRENAVYLHTLLALSDQTATLSTRKRENPKHHETYVLYKKKHMTYASGFKRFEGEIDVYCVEVPTSFFLIRKNDEILVTGNCYKMALTDAISVACKALGFGADVYWDKDTTKYNAPEKAQQNPQNPAIPAQQKPGYRLPPQTDETVICDRCGGQVMDYFDGRARVKAARMAARAKEVYGYALCEKCVAAAKEVNSAAG